jgi:transposase-like protein
MKQHTEDYKLTAVKYYLDHNEDMRDTCEIFKCKHQSLSRWIKTYFFSQLKHYIKKESPNTYDDIYNVITNILEKKIQKKHLENYLKHSYKIYKS